MRFSLSENSFAVLIVGLCFSLKLVELKILNRWCIIQVISELVLKIG